MFYYSTRDFWISIYTSFCNTSVYFWRYAYCSDIQGRCVYSFLKRPGRRALYELVPWVQYSDILVLVAFQFSGSPVKFLSIVFYSPKQQTSTQCWTPLRWLVPSSFTTREWPKNNSVFTIFRHKGRTKAHPKCDLLHKIAFVINLSTLLNPQTIHW